MKSDPRVFLNMGDAHVLEYKQSGRRLWVRDLFFRRLPGPDRSKLTADIGTWRTSNRTPGTTLADLLAMSITLKICKVKARFRETDTNYVP